MTGLCRIAQIVARVALVGRVQSLEIWRSSLELIVGDLGRGIMVHWKVKHRMTFIFVLVAYRKLSVLLENLEGTAIAERSP